jgi:hypothetical protein
MNIAQVVNSVEIAIHKLPYMETLYKQVKDEVKLQYTRQHLMDDIEARKNKISILDATTFIFEQECRRKEQQIQELTAEMDRIEKFIANILNDNEGYSNLKQVAKENVKAVLSDNKMLISTAFAAMIQTLKADPQIVKLIQNIPHAKDGEQHKDNDINIINYLESNKDMILALTEKNYENLVEALTNDSISSAAVYSSNSMLLCLNHHLYSQCSQCCFLYILL